MKQKLANDEIDLRELGGVLWRGRLLLVVITALAALIAVLIVMWIPNQYKATTVLAPATSASSTGALTQLSGLASLAGIALNSGSGGESQIAMEVMQSWDFIDKFIRENQLEVAIFAANGWDRDTNQLKIDPNLYSAAQKKWVRDPPTGKTVEPTSWELFDEFTKHLSVTQDKTTGLVTVDFEFYSPALAREILEKYVKAINEYMRSRKLDESGRNISYLATQVEKTPIAELKGVFYSLIEEETKGRMLAEARPEYSFISVSPAMLPEETSRPRRLLIVVFVTLFGGILASVVVLMRSILLARAHARPE